MAKAPAIQLDATVKAAQRYESLTSARNPFLVRARECSVLTIPSIMPPQGFNSNTKLATPYQSLGARGARTLASKLLLSLFPASIPFFNYRMDDDTVEQTGTQRGEVEKALASRERSVHTEQDTCVFRPAAFMALMHLIVTGNIIVRVPPEQDDRAQCFRLDQFVARRDAAGNLLEFIIKETTDLQSLPEGVRKGVLTIPDYAAKALESKAKLDAEPLDMYTHVIWDADALRWVIYQEVAGIRIPGSDGSYKKDELPYLVLRFATQPGEHYGRSYVEEYLGDLDSLEALSETLVEGSAASARIVFLVDPAGTTSLKVVANAKTGDVKAGRAEDVTVMQVQKQNDLNVAKQQAEEIATRLSYAFLLHSSIQRAGERVTAEEIRYMASELDDGLGGVYTLLAADFQLPSVRLFEKRMEKRLGAKALPAKGVQPIIVTGLEAIGRGHEQRNLQAFMQDIIAVLTPQIAMQYFIPTELISRAAAGYSIDTTGLLKTPEQIAQEQQQAQMASMTQNLGPEGIKQLGAMANTSLKGQMAPPTQGA